MHEVKKTLGILLTLLLLITFVTPKTSFAETKTLDGAKIIEGRTLLPLRSIFETLGATVDWNGKTNTVTAVKENIKIQLTINSKTAKVNGITKVLDVPGKIIDNKTMVPVRFVSEAIGATIAWNKENRFATIIYKDQQIKVYAHNDARYLRKINNNYTYIGRLGYTITDTFVTKENGFNKWKRSAQILAVGDPGYIFLFEKEDTNGIHEASEDLSYIYSELKYPLVEGKVWLDSESENKYEVKSINKSIKTKAGTFNNVVEIVKYNYYDSRDKSSYYLSKMYYAPNNGLILVLEDDEITFELVKITKK